jgi:hypothetical protein
MSQPQKITPFLWFDGNAEAAVEFYLSLFPGKSKVLSRMPGPGGKLRQDPRERRQAHRVRLDRRRLRPDLADHPERASEAPRGSRPEARRSRDGGDDADGEARHRRAREGRGGLKVGDRSRGVASVRLAAAEKALDLRTKKSELERFVGPT